MKILSVDQIRQADAYTVEHEPISSLDLMERAAGKLAKWMTKRVDNSHTFRIFSGPGNNGGDGLALARMLAAKDYQVIVYVLSLSGKYSDNFQLNMKRLKKTKKVNIHFIENKKDFPVIDEEDIVVDAIFGSGLKKPAEGLAADLIHHINQSPAVRIAVDIPSGLFADSHSATKNAAIVSADYTLSFQVPKLAFLLPENDRFVGKFEVLDIGLSAEFINSAETREFYMEERDIAPMLRHRGKYSHKGTFGHALLMAGSWGKFGAAVLASKACLRSGVGLLHTHVAKSGVPVLQTATPETMLSIDRDEMFITEIPSFEMFNAVGIGPGIGMEKQTQQAVKLMIQEYPGPVVFDADALNILAENKTWLSFLKPGCILTPHPKEFERLAGPWKNNFEKIKVLRSFTKKHNIYVVLKGAHTITCFPDGQLYFNSTGNPGMATAGSGDVLTGIITGLLAQGYTPGVASVMGVYLHGLAGDIAAKKHGQQAMLAGDIIENIGKAFRKISR